MKPIPMAIGAAKHAIVFLGTVAGDAEHQQQQLALERDLERITSDIGTLTGTAPTE